MTIQNTVIDCAPHVEGRDKIRLELLKQARMKSGYSLDFWADFTEGLDVDQLRILVSKAEMLKNG